jgi:Tfp pilus assembly protein FimT
MQENKKNLRDSAPSAGYIKNFSASLRSQREVKKNLSASPRPLRDANINLNPSAPSAPSAGGTKNLSASLRPLREAQKIPLRLRALCGRQKKNLSASPRPLREAKKNLRISTGKDIYYPKSNSSIHHSIHHSSFIIHHSSNRGFTLIEIVAIVIITAILAIVVLPNIFSGYSSVKVSTALGQVADDIRYCREEAEATRDTCWISFDVANNRYTLYRHYPSGTLLTNPVTQENFQVQLGQGSLDGLTLSAVSFTAPASNHLAFTPFGAPVGGGSITLNGSRVITVEPETGTLDIQ